MLALGTSLWAVSHRALLMQDRPSSPDLKPEEIDCTDTNTWHTYICLQV
jgi:hypothetical protein